MNSKIAKLTSFLSCFCGRYEYRAMDALLKKINAGDNVAENLEKLKAELENFQCVSTLEIEQRKEALKQLSLIISEIQHPENVQSSETPAPDAGTKDTGSTEAPDAQGVANPEVENQPAATEEVPAETEQPAAETPTETPAETTAETPAEQPAAPKRGRKK